MSRWARNWNFDALRPLDTLLSSSNEDVSLVNQKIDGELSQLDYATASIDLNNYQLSLQATQKTYLKINGLSLFGML